MNPPPHSLSVLLVSAGDPALEASLAAAGCTVSQAATMQDAARHDATLLTAGTGAELAALALLPGLPQAAFDSALVLQMPGGAADQALEADLLRLGVEALVPAGDTVRLARELRHAVARKQAERAARNAYATDLATGLPHQAQLLEHMTQLLALREREPAPMVLLVLRIEGYASAAARLGAESANILRRKVAVRLRSGLRASDVVAAIGPDAFGVLLGHVEARGDGERVAAKLVDLLHQPFKVAAQTCSVAAAVGLALYPDHGKDAQALLQRASAQAGSVATLGAAGFAAGTERALGSAANDER
jgi:diguanylate cyclase (GGDEF)-like protein